MMKYIFTNICFFLALNSIAQNVGINNTDPKSALDVNGGFRLRPITSLVSGTTVTLASNHGYHFISGTPTGNFTISLLPLPNEGQHTIITNTTGFTGNVFSISIPPATTVELFYSNGGWKQIGSSQAATSFSWGLMGNTGINPATHFIGTTSNADLIFKRNNVQSGLINSANQNTSWGFAALFPGNNGSENTANGSSTLFNNTSGNRNTANGAFALYANISGSDNTATGRASLYFNNEGTNNTATGVAALYANKDGNNNTAVGSLALRSNTYGHSNVAIGASALHANTTQSNLVAIGDSALYNNGVGAASAGFAEGNTAVGSKALFQNTVGAHNTAIGLWALRNNISGDLNTAIGHISSVANISGIYNTSIGGSALQLNRFSNFNVAIGNDALKLYNPASEEDGNNVAIGAYTLHQHATGVDNVAVGRSALSFNYAGNRNTAIGSGAGERSYNSSGNVFIGFDAGTNADHSNNKLYIENSNKDSLSALIYGDFAADSLLLNAKTINRNSFNIRGANALEMGYGATNKQTDAGKICYGCFGDPAHWLGIVGGGLQANNGNDRVIKLWSEGGLRIRGNTIPDFGSTYTLGTNANAWRSVTTDSVRSNAYMLRNSSMHIVGATGELIFRLNNSDIAKVTSGGISPAADNDVYLGSPSRRFVSVYATIGVIQTSDASLKTNIQPTSYGLAEVLALNPVEYNWKENPAGEKMVGLLAQEVQNIIPEAVVAPVDGSPLGMKYNELIPVLIKAIQEQQKEIENLKKKLHEKWIKKR